VRLLSQNFEDIPACPADFYSRSAIHEPHATYRALLDAGPIVRLTKQKALAVTRFAPLRSLLKNDSDFVSSKGVTMNSFLNKMSANSDTVLVTDGEKHNRLRRILMAPMRPRELEAIVGRVRQTADEKVDELVGRGHFEGMSELASHLPVHIVAELVGLPPTERAKMVEGHLQYHWPLQSPIAADIAIRREHVLVPTTTQGQPSRARHMGSPPVRIARQR